MIISADAGPGRSVQATWNYTLGSIVLVLVVLDASLILLALESFNGSTGILDGVLLALLALSSAMNVRYCWFLRAGLDGGLPGTAWTLALVGPAAACWVAGLYSPDNRWLAAVPLWLAICLLACLASRRNRWVLLGAGLALTALHVGLAAAVFGQRYDLAPDSGTRFLLVFAAFMPFMLLTSLWWWRIVVELDRHRRLAGELAVTQERLRFAADLHDIQGHHLQVIALKAELAERLLTIDVEAAREHVHETRVIAKQALEETRSLVSGYREIALDNELQNAREVLSATGAHCELTLGPLPADPAVHRALAMTVREATTNILRHSEATRARIALGTSADGCTLTISNNGLTSREPSGKTPGSGLAGLRGRVETLGGSLDTILDAGRDHFELAVWVPTRIGAAT
ncbi:histidine kinase [Arthrobacter sp. ERGS1:01]|uniref:sensor histidine kinase n=1 Tax=Arthrobacter sp. ERGS1:01 TaxID=1704044 RepID=UPI0006B6520B|nr:histidine kinase [Arthrobacter sp. ERGS1:01]ALE07299.1 histidine kinase [Arthrobacter sp. ERGS1:01]